MFLIFFLNIMKSFIHKVLITILLHIIKKKTKINKKNIAEDLIGF
jgi:hypothetical protein